MNEKMIIRSSDSVFLNSKSVFVEYIDIIKSPYFLFLYALKAHGSKDLKEPFDVRKITDLKDAEELARWYYSRQNQNPLIDLIPEDRIHLTNFEKVDQFMDLQLKENPILINSSSPLNFVRVIRNLMTDSILVPKVYIWYPYENENVRNDINQLFNNTSIEYVYGDLEKCLQKVPNDSTFVFSDISNLLVLEATGKLEMSSILLPIDFKYNSDENGNPLLDLEKWHEDYTFKSNYFLSTSS